MKLAVVLLVLLGVVAAGAAAIFVQTIPQLRQRQIPKVEVLVATRDIEPRTPLSEDLIEVKQLARTGLPTDFMSDWSQVAGKMFKLKVAKGQVLANSQLMLRNSIDDLLQPGMLAFPAPLPRRSTAVDLLYPGCVVDVFATFPLTNREKGEAVVTPLLQNITVLAIADETVIVSDDPKVKEEAAAAKRRTTAATGNVTVTLEVTARQAAALQLCLERGTLGLAMRNRADTGWNPMEPMVVKEGQLTAASEALDPQTLAWVQSIQRALNPNLVPDPNTMMPPRPTTPLTMSPRDPNMVVNTGPMPAPPMPGEMTGFPTRKSTWQMTVIRGQKVEEEELELQEKKEEGQEEEVMPEVGG